MYVCITDYNLPVNVCVQKVALDVANSSSVLNSLKHFEYKDANGKDHVCVLFSFHMAF